MNYQQYIARLQTNCNEEEEIPDELPDYLE